MIRPDNDSFSLPLASNYPAFSLSRLYLMLKVTVISSHYSALIPQSSLYHKPWSSLYISSTRTRVSCPLFHLDLYIIKTFPSLSLNGPLYLSKMCLYPAVKIFLAHCCRFIIPLDAQKNSTDMFSFRYLCFSFPCLFIP